MDANTETVVPAREASRILEAIARLGIFVERQPMLLDYLRAHPQVSGAIENVASVLIQRFGGRAEISLEFFKSRDTDDEHALFVLRQSAYDKELMRNIRDLLKESDDLFGFSSGWIGVTSDFAPPKHGV